MGETEKNADETARKDSETKGLPEIYTNVVFRNFNFGLSNFFIDSVSLSRVSD